MSTTQTGTEPVYVIPHTHWDREWYLSFEEFRARLVRTVDTILEALEGDPDWVFTLDGQAVALEDYLELRPEAGGRIRALVECGRLAIGPMYVLPDEWLCTGEAACQNLALGTRVCARFGGASPVGYLPDMFGHVGQMPQILRHAGLDVAVLWRGADLPREAGAFRWEAVDGSQVITQYLPQGYGDVTHLGDDPTEFARRLTQALEKKGGYRGPGPDVLCQGTDHLPMFPHMTGWLREVNANGGDGRYRLGTWSDFFAAARPVLAAADLPTITGELRNSRRAHILPGTLTSRYPVKRAHGQAERALIDWADAARALAVVAGVEAGDAAARLHEHAWKLHLKNLAHDTICGCSVDRVHEEGIVRSHKAEDLARALGAEALDALAPVDAEGEVDFVLLRARPSGDVWAQVEVEADRDEPVPGVAGAESYVARGDLGTVRVQQGETPALLAEALEFHVWGQAGEYMVRRVSYGEEDGVHVLRFHLTKEIALVPDYEEVWAWVRSRPETGEFRVELREPTRAQVRFRAGASSRMGVEGMRLDPAAPAREADIEELPVGEVVVVGDLGLSVEEDGTFTLAAGGVTLAGLHGWRDVGDRGDEYNHDPVGDPAGRFEVTARRVQRFADQAAQVTVEGALHLPAKLGPDRQVRLRGEVACPVTIRARLEAGDPVVHFETDLENRARDHHLSVTFPTPWDASETVAGQPFAACRRPVQLPDAEGWIEKPQPYFPFQGWFQAAGGARRLVVLAEDLYEFGARPGVDGLELSLTLLRATEWLSRDDLVTRRRHAGPPMHTPEAQDLGVHRFRYGVALVPARGPGGWDLEGAFAHPPSTLSTGQRRRLAAVPGLHVEGDGVVVSSWRPAPAPEDSDQLLRVFAPGGAAVVRVRAEVTGAVVRRVDLHGVGDDVVDGDLELGPGELATLRIGVG